MLRKVNRVGKSTLTVSIPSKWAKAHNLQQGDQVDVVVENEHLIIGSKPLIMERSINIDLSGFGSMLNRTVAAIYKAGFHNGRVSYATPAELDVIQGTIDRSCHVFEIMKVSEEHLDFNTFSALDPESFDNIFRKVGYAVLDMAEETYNALKTRDEEKLHAVIMKDKIVDRHTDYCRRIANIGHELPYNLTGPLYVIAEQYEVLADIFKTLSKDVIEKKLEIQEDELQILKRIVEMVKHFHETLIHFNTTNIQELGKVELDIRDLFDKACGQTRSNARILCHTHNIFETAFEMKSALLTLKISAFETTRQEG